MKVDTSRMLNENRYIENFECLDGADECVKLSENETVGGREGCVYAYHYQQC